MNVLRAGDAPSTIGDRERYSGTVWTTALVTGEPPHRLHVVRATFEPGARTAWHTHPFGQILIATSGTGRVQVAGEPVRVLAPGDSAAIAPGERHWHGAGPDQLFTHISIQGATPDGTMADWADLVSDAD